MTSENDESHDAIVVVETPETTVEHHEPEPIALGQWYLVKYKNGEFLECVTHIGSNYVEMTGVNEQDHRVHIDQFHSRCRRELNAPKLIAGKVLGYQTEVRRLMGEVQAITARLGVGQSPALSAGMANEGAALARLDSNTNVEDYKASLVKAKKEDLPELFGQIETANSRMAMWMKAEVLPLKAQAEQMKGVIGRIDDRIFNVELYAGLTEKVVQITEGEPAEMTEKVRLLQRRHYMDEECLAQYKVGGMEFDDIGEFDDWLADEENRDRLLPFPRCIVAFRVRRRNKQRPVPSSFIEFFDQLDRIEADKLTFLYIRNGEKLYRMNTRLEFGARLFPDAQHHKLMAGTQLWAEVHGDRVGDILTDHQYQGLVEDYARQKAEYDAKKAAHPALHKAWRKAKKEAKKAGQPFTEREPYLGYFSGKDPRGKHELYEPNNIHYDDIQKKIAEEIQQANRIAIIIQGLLDRSPVLHPHPPWKIWSEGGAEQALELIYDDSRALATGEQPDFEAYRERLNKLIKPGSITIGQQAAWHAQQSEEDDYGRRRGKRRVYGNNGPGELAKVVSVQARAGKCTYAWSREGQSRDNWEKRYRCSFACEIEHLFNVSAYTPGDFKQFFADPRTRADYIQWAPFLLEAEEYHAGNREGKVAEPPVKVKRAPSADGGWAYRRRKARNALLGKAVRLKDRVTMRNGKVYAKGTLFRAEYIDRGLYIAQINEDGTYLEDGGRIRGMEHYDLEEDPSIPPRPVKEKPKPAPEPDDDDEDDDEEDDIEPEDDDSDDDENDIDDEDDDHEDWEDEEGDERLLV